MKDVALLLVDIQKGFDVPNYWGTERNNPFAEENCALILNRFRQLQHPIFHVRHSSTNPKSPLHITHDGFQFKPEVFPEAGEFVITKNVNSAFIGTDLKKILKQLKIKSVVIVGFTTDHCISTTARMSGNLGYATTVISDATATHNKTGILGEAYSAETIHLTSLASLNEEFATIINTKDLLTELSS